MGLYFRLPFRQGTIHDALQAFTPERAVPLNTFHSIVHTVSTLAYTAVEKAKKDHFCGKMYSQTASHLQKAYP
jgi:hypothetical protein